jgi:hypothetical protein
MFVRFRETASRLQVSILETRRAGGKVVSEHVASIGSVGRPLSVQGRQIFWAQLWDRLASLSNRIGPDDQAKIRNAVHARIPMVMPEEANADEAKYWETYSAMFVKNGAELRAMAADDIRKAEAEEDIAAIFAVNPAAALKGERPMERVVVGELLAAKVGVGRELGVVRAVKRHRNDRRRRRGGFRFTPDAVEGWKG